MKLGHCTVTFGDQEVQVTSVSTSFSHGDGMEVSIEGRIMEKKEKEESPARGIASLAGEDWVDSFTYGFDNPFLNLASVSNARNHGKSSSYEHMLPIEKIGRNSMELTIRPDEDRIKLITGDWNYAKGKDMNCGKSLTEQLADLDHDEDKQTLIRDGLMTSSGVLTNEGERFLLNMLARENISEMADAVREVKEANKD